jgi:hypothetical protein
MSKSKVISPWQFVSPALFREATAFGASSNLPAFFSSTFNVSISSEKSNLVETRP